MLPTAFQLTTLQHRDIRSLTQDIKPFLSNIIFHHTNPHLSDIEEHSKHTIRLVREYLASYLFYIRYKTLDINTSQNPFQIIFNPVHKNNFGT